MADSVVSTPSLLVARNVAADAGGADAASFSRVTHRANGRRWLAIALTTLGLVYLSMLNRYWVPSGDGEVYTCTARALARGEGLMFNGARSAIAPPGWSMVLSWAMRISPEFWFLKLVVISCMLSAMSCAYFILRRFVTDRAAAGVVMLTGVLSSVYPLTYWMHTEAFFCLLGFAALLLAFRIAEGVANLKWEAPLMLALLAAGAFTRWPGVLHVVLVVPILLSGANQPWKRFSIWIITLLSIAVCFGTLKATYSYLSLTKEEKQLAIASGGGSDAESDEDVTTDAPLDVLPATIPTTLPTTAPVLVDTGNDSQTPDGDDFRGSGKRSAVEEVAYRIGTSGKWFAWLLWQPTRFGQSVSIINLSALVAGWLAIAMLILAMVRGIARRQYLWVGLALYTGGLCVLWPNPNARYFVPVAPFIVLGILMGIQVVSDLTRRKSIARSAKTPPVDSELATRQPAAIDSLVTRATPIASIHIRSLSWPAKGLMIAFVLATLASNLPLLAVDIWVFRSSDFYGRYEAGSNKELMIAAQFINDHPRPGRVAVCELYDNMGRERWSKFGQRALHLLTDKQVITPPRKAVYKDRPTKDRPRIWAKKVGNDVDYYVYQSTWNPWRVWHYRLSFDLQEKLTGRPQFRVESGGWELFARNNINYPRLRLKSDLDQPPTRVPGL